MQISRLNFLNIIMWIINNIGLADKTYLEQRRLVMCTCTLHINFLKIFHVIP